MTPLCALLDDDRRVRLRAARRCGGAGLAYVLRRVLFTDEDAAVRAAAARRLGQLDGDEHAAWLIEAITDRAPMVRDAVIRGLTGSAAACPALRARLAHDRVWWVRRAAVYALAAAGGAGELAALEAALGDPFWRVRHAAVKVLAVLGRDPGARAQLAAAPPSDALTYLRGAWGPVAVEAPVRAGAASALPAALLDPDPAVVTARLAGDHAASPVALVELLCDPHVPLRELAVAQIAASGDGAAYRAALDWLEEPRIPHVADTVERLLDGLGDPAAALAAETLARPDLSARPAAARWAVGWAVAARASELYAAVLACAEADPRLRDAALAVADDAALVRWAGAAATAPALVTPDPGALCDAIAAELHARQAYLALRAIDPVRPRVRALQVDAAARTGDWLTVQAALADPHHGPRAVAARWWSRDRALPFVDRDPAVREAGLTAASAAAFVDDDDPFVARAAIELAAEAPARALASPDPWVRAQACLRATDLDAVLARLADPSEMVRSAALEALSARPALTATGSLADAWAARSLDDAALATLAHVAMPAAAPAAVAAPPPTPPAVERRPLAGFAIAPLIVSGAHDLDADDHALAAAHGVDTWFWEPGYDELGRFLRGHRGGRVITGSYHADAASIGADVDLALRRLKRDRLDVFLLFWSRSPARVTPAAFATLDRLRRAGKLGAVGFSTHDRTLARNAIAASPWDAVMIRHSAAHPGIETELLPHAAGTAIVTFSALCYGRMVTGPGAPSPADCYRYSLSQPGVVGCITAPRRRRELIENLTALRTPSLDTGQLAALRAHGIGVRAEDRRFTTLMRQPTRDAAAAARELLAAALPPTDEPVALPRRAASRGTRARLGGRSR